MMDMGLIMISKGNINMWINKIYSLSFNNKTDKALDVMYDAVDEQLLDGNIDLVDKWMMEIDLNRINIALMLGILTITKPFKEKLSARKDFYLKVRDKIIETDAERCDKLLIGLE